MAFEQENLWLPRLITDGMVLQRGGRTRIWGRCRENDSVIVALKDEKGRPVAQGSGKADAAGTWEVFLALPFAGTGYCLTVETAGGQRRQIADVAVGEVWLCSGQSNMELPMQRVKDRFPEEEALCGDEQLRIFKINEHYEFGGPLEDHLSGEWKKSGTETLWDFSALTYFYGKFLRQALKVPVGLINASLGGSPIEAWMGKELFEGEEDVLARIGRYASEDFIAEKQRREEAASAAWYARLNSLDMGQREGWFFGDQTQEGWDTMELPGMFADRGLEGFIGVIWLRKRFAVPDTMVHQAARLWLGTLVDSDETYVNGVLVGSTGYQYPPRKYDIPEGLLHAGENTVVIRLTCNDGRGRMTPDKPYRVFTREDCAELSGEWEYRIGARIQEPAPGVDFVSWKPTGLYNGMLAPCRKFTVKGFVWYQGESHDNMYEKRLKQMIFSWREQWGLGNLPFLIAQLPGFSIDLAEDGSWPAIREIQRRAGMLPAVATTVNLDLGEWNDLHPLDKKGVAYRLSLAARAVAYKEKVTWQGPTVSGCRTEKGKIILTFSNAEGGLMTQNGEQPGEFEVAGADGKYDAAEAVIEGKNVILDSGKIPNPVSVRYAWKNCPDRGLLYNREGLLASPFQAMCMYEMVGKQTPCFFMDESEYPGVRKIARKVAKDFETVSGRCPEIRQPSREGEEIPFAVIIGTLGKSPVTERMEKEGKLRTDELCGKREVYSWQLVDNPVTGVGSALVICGSDKRGTIYGMFRLSELIGVTPFVYWGDVVPARYDRILIGEGKAGAGEAKKGDDGCLILNIPRYLVSKEPSVKYRGFFINDEWPCFGSWTFEHFGGFTAQMYDHVFELLLRLKGNYLWPAMWSSSFALDGPGLANAELADSYGIVIGNSHHEPCLRASEEWDLVKGENTGYGTEWNYYKNREGLLRYWEGGLARSGKYESMVTIGMRGERDSSMLGPDASLQENIELLKDIIREQRKLIARRAGKDASQVPQLLALYKEVEAYFYGDEQTRGLKDWEELDGVTFMLCEDNFGNMRTLPPRELRDRKGGWGMYYHFDYHGGPLSYEWVDSTPLTKVWEQMSMAYDYGIREVWIVNVGDLKFNAFPLGYFMSLACDFEKWGTDAPNQTAAYTQDWVEKQFGSFADQKLQEEIAWVQEEYVRLNGLRRPESLNDTVYHPAHAREAEKMLCRAALLEKKNAELFEKLPEEAKGPYYSMIYYPAAATANLLRMHLYAGLNHLYCSQGRVMANRFGELVTECIRQDRKLSKEFGESFGGKWHGMEKAHHVGFTHWCEEDYRYPVRYVMEPAEEPRLVVVKADEVKSCTSGYALTIDDFLTPGRKEAALQIANGGIGSFDWKIEGECEWLDFSAKSGTVTGQEEVTVRVLYDKVPGDGEIVSCMFAVRTDREKVPFCVRARRIETKGMEKGTFLMTKNAFVVDAVHYGKALEAEYEGKKAAFCALYDYGKIGTGMKVFPTTAVFEQPDAAPSLTYSIWAEKAGNYVLEIQTAPGNPVSAGGKLRCAVRVNETEFRIVNTVGENYRGGDHNCEEWCRGVLDGIHKTRVGISLESGRNSITVCVLDAPLVLERFVIFQEGSEPEDCYLGP